MLLIFVYLAAAHICSVAARTKEMGPAFALLPLLKDNQLFEGLLLR